LKDGTPTLFTAGMACAIMATPSQQQLTLKIGGTMQGIALESIESVVAEPKRDREIFDPLGLPQAIQDAALNLATINAELQRARARLIFESDQILLAVLTATDAATGKPLFTNEAQRGLAIRDGERTSEKFRDAENWVADWEFKRAEATAWLERLRNELRVWQTDTDSLMWRDRI
jgi:hypothetical protein